MTKNSLQKKAYLAIINFSPSARELVNKFNVLIATPLHIKHANDQREKWYKQALEASKVDFVLVDIISPTELRDRVQ